MRVCMHEDPVPYVCVYGRTHALRTTAACWSCWSPRRSCCLGAREEGWRCKVAMPFLADLRVGPKPGTLSWTSVLLAALTLFVTAGPWMCLRLCPSTEHWAFLVLLPNHFVIPSKVNRSILGHGRGGGRRGRDSRMHHQPGRVHADCWVNLWDA